MRGLLIPGPCAELIGSADFEKAADDDEISVYQLAGLISGRHRFARDAGRRLYIFRGGTYHPDAATFVHQRLNS